MNYRSILVIITFDNLISTGNQKQLKTTTTTNLIKLGYSIIAYK